MTLGQKLKEIRKRFGLSQEQLAEIINVSRQAITKWENDGGLPDITNLQELSKVFGITVDYLLNDENQLPALSMKKELNKDKYKSKLSSYGEILKEYFPEPWEVYTLLRKANHSKISWILDDWVFGAGTIDVVDALNDMTPYYLVKKGELKLLVNISDSTLEAIELPTNTDDKKFIYEKNKFKVLSRLKLSE